jgi:hypothetical protein
VTALTSRGYVYQVPADPANGAAATQALAASVDTDISACMPDLGVSSFGGWPQVSAMCEYPFVLASANDALVVAIKPRATITPTKLVWYPTVQSGNYDVAIINLATRVRLWSLGSTACPAAPSEVINAIVAGPTLAAGTRYGLVFAANNTTLQLFGNYGAGTPIGVSTMYDGVIGCGVVATSFPIPATLGAWAGTGRTPFLALRA